MRPQLRHKSKSPIISIVIPAYNEERRLPNSLRKLRSYLDRLEIDFEVIVVVEKSQDETLMKSRSAVSEDIRFKILDNKIHRGKGYAVKTGMMKSSGQYTFFMDADLSTNLSSINDFLDVLINRSDVQILIGNRAHPQSIIVTKQSLIRRCMGKTYGFLIRALGISKFQDTQCGFKAFKRPVARKLFASLKTDGFAFDVELLARADIYGYKVIDMPVVWTNSKDSKVKIFGSPVSMLTDIWRIKRAVGRKPTGA